MDINFNGYQENVLTFECGDAVEAGDLVAMASSGKVAKAAENNTFIGKCLSVKGGYAAVQLSGYMEEKKSGTVSLGFVRLVTGAGGVKSGSAGRECLVVYSDDTNVGFIM